jgi:hypothetical protein
VKINKFINIMTNYKTFKITSKELTCGDPTFYLDSRLTYKDGNRDFIICDANYFSFNDYHEGDYLEIDTDRIKNCRSGDSYDTSAVRKVSSSAIVSSNSSQQMTTSQFQALGNQMMDRAEQSGGRMEAR